MENTEVTPEEPPSAVMSGDLPLPVAQDLVVIARNSSEMALAQAQLLAWAEAKIEVEKAALVDAEAQLAMAKSMKHRTVAYTKQVNLAKDSVNFYEKLKLAIQAGYTIVPNFPVQTIAIRTKRMVPKYHQYNARSHFGLPEVDAERLPAGDGHYVDPVPSAGRKTLPAAGEGSKEMTVIFPTRFREVAFPATLAKVEVLQHLDRALKTKIFDSIGILPTVPKKKVDPMIIGQIHHKVSSTVTRVTSFMIAWWVDTRGL
jgi:hypothetical protein